MLPRIDATSLRAWLWVGVISFAGGSALPTPWRKIIVG
jgi:hypothetical protein